MRNCQRLIETLHDETGLAAEIVIVYTEEGLWNASIREDGHLLLCAAGEYWLHAVGYSTVDDALEELESIVTAGYRLAAEHAA
jgi:hypothetical protein